MGPDCFTHFKLCVQRIWVRMLSERLVKFLEFDEGVIGKDNLVGDDLFLIILNKQQSFLYQRLCLRDSKSSSQ